MDFLKVLLLILAFAPQARADFSGADLTTETAAGPGDVYSLGGGARLKFDTGDVHFNYTKQLSPSDPNVASGPSKHTDNWSGGLEHNLAAKWSLGLDYDSLSDEDEKLFSAGTKVTVNYDIYHLSYRFARSKIEQNFLVFEPRAARFALLRGVFIYQSTIDASADIPLNERDTLSPGFSYSIFSPDVARFSSLLSRRFAANLSNFTDTLQSLENWSASAVYAHEMNEQWGTSFRLVYSRLITGNNPSIEVVPAITRKWTKLFSTEVSFDYAYIPGSPTWTGNVELQYHFGKSEEEETDEE